MMELAVQIVKFVDDDGLAFAMTSAGSGLVWLAFLALNSRVVSVCELVCALFVAWGLNEARQTHRVLGRTRAELLKDIRIVR